MFDHEAGYADYHRGRDRWPEYEAHQETYATSYYPAVNLETAENESELNDTESNLYHSWPVYSPYVSHDWMLKHKHNKKAKKHADTFDDVADDFSLGNQLYENAVTFDDQLEKDIFQTEEVSEQTEVAEFPDDKKFEFDILPGLRRMDFEGLTDNDRVTKFEKAIIMEQPCKCIHGTEACCEFETHEHEDLLEYFEAPTVGHPFH